jgi:solute carrier family 25 citrate transporter 1
MAPGGQQQQRRSALAGLVSGAFAGAVEAVVTMPLEGAKLRQQLGSKHGDGLVRSLRAALREGGLRALYAGLALQVAQNSGKVGIRFLVFDQLAGDGDATRKALAGVAAGCVESLLWITPCERLKIMRIQRPAEPLRLLLRAAWERGLWAGATPTMLRNGGTVGFRFYTYELVVDRFCGGNAALGGAFVGALSSVINNSVDVVKTEMQRGEASAGSRGGMLACARAVARDKGFQHLFMAGLPARMLKISIGQAVIFQVVDALQEPTRKFATLNSATR